MQTTITRTKEGLLLQQDALIDEEKFYNKELKEKIRTALLACRLGYENKMFTRRYVASVVDLSIDEEDLQDFNKSIIDFRRFLYQLKV